MTMIIITPSAPVSTPLIYPERAQKAWGFLISGHVHESSAHRRPD